MKVTIAIIPAFLIVCAVILLAFFPLTEAKHGIIRRRLEQRAERHQTVPE
jgi:Na+/melibiose symporter-like transporter